VRLAQRSSRDRCLKTAPTGNQESNDEGCAEGIDNYSQDEDLREKVNRLLPHALAI
jgi:hypothetical protein